MMKKHVKIISSCDSCPDVIRQGAIAPRCALKDKKYIPQVKARVALKIPGWCPLPDLDVEEDKNETP